MFVVEFFSQVEDLCTDHQESRFSASSRAVNLTPQLRLALDISFHTEALIYCTTFWALQNNRAHRFSLMELLQEANACANTRNRLILLTRCSLPPDDLFNSQ